MLKIGIFLVVVLQVLFQELTALPAERKSSESLSSEVNLPSSNDIIGSNLLLSNSEDAMFKSVIRRKEGMYLLALEKLIPAMESLRDEISKSLQSSSSSEDLIRESDLSDLKMLMIEHQMKSSQVLVKRFLSLQSQIRNITERRHEFMGEMTAIQDNHARTLKVTIQRQDIEKIESLKRLLNQRPYPSEEILTLIDGQENESSRAVLLWTLLNTMEISKETLGESNLLVEVGRMVLDSASSSIAELSLLPEIIPKMFSLETLTLQSSKTGRFLTRDGLHIKAVYDIDDVTFKWKIVAVPGSKSFVIQDSESELLLGVSRRRDDDDSPHHHIVDRSAEISDDRLTTVTYDDDSFMTTEASSQKKENQFTSPDFKVSSKPDPAQGQEEASAFLPPTRRRPQSTPHPEQRLEVVLDDSKGAREDPVYHWNILASAGTKPGEVLLKFVNVASGQALDGNTSGDVYPHKSLINNGFQNWKLV